MIGESNSLVVLERGRAGGGGAQEGQPGLDRQSPCKPSEDSAHYPGATGSCREWGEEGF